MNATLFSMMQDTCKSNFDLPNLALYRYQRYQQSIAQNPDFYFGPFSLLLYGAATFLYELMPNGNHAYAPDLPTISSFFGAQQKADGSWFFNGKETIPDNWTNRVAPYTTLDVGTQILEMYALHPVLFGGNTADGSFDAINWEGIKNGKLDTSLNATTVACLLYQLSTERVPSSLNGLLTPTVEALAFVASKVAPQFKNLGCPTALT